MAVPSTRQGEELSQRKHPEHGEEGTIRVGVVKAGSKHSTSLRVSDYRKHNLSAGKVWPEAPSRREELGLGVQLAVKQSQDSHVYIRNILILFSLNTFVWINHELENNRQHNKTSVCVVELFSKQKRPNFAFQPLKLDNLLCCASLFHTVINWTYLAFGLLVRQRKA